MAALVDGVKDFRMAAGAAMLATVMLACGTARAAPVTGTPEESAEPASPGALPSLRTAPGAGPSKAPELSTGNRNLDMLLDMQTGAAGAAGATRAASRPTAGVVKVPTPNTNLSGGVLTRIEAGSASAPARHAEVLGDLRDDLRAKSAGQGPAEQRKWGELSSAGGGGGRYEADGSGEARARSAYVQEPEAMRILREGVEWLRQNRWEVLGTLLAIAGLTALLKVYARRP